jgi:hypothetical protein
MDEDILSPPLDPITKYPTLDDLLDDQDDPPPTDPPPADYDSDTNRVAPDSGSEGPSDPFDSGTSSSSDEDDNPRDLGNPDEPHITLGKLKSDQQFIEMVRQAILVSVHSCRTRGDSESLGGTIFSF